MTKIKIKKLHPNAVVPQYAHGPDEDSGMDLYAVEDCYLTPLVPTLVKTGIAIELPPGFEAQIRPRSGLALRDGVTVWNAPGTVDPAYRGEIGVILLWTGYADEHVFGPRWSQAYRVMEGDRIAQMVVAKYEGVEFELTGDLDSSSRGTKGFGSTGL